MLPQQKSVRVLPHVPLSLGECGKVRHCARRSTSPLLQPLSTTQLSSWNARSPARFLFLYNRTAVEEAALGGAKRKGVMEGGAASPSPSPCPCPPTTAFLGSQVGMESKEVTVAERKGAVIARILFLLALRAPTGTTPFGGGPGGAVDKHEMRSTPHQFVPPQST